MDIRPPFRPRLRKKQIQPHIRPVQTNEPNPQAPDDTGRRWAVGLALIALGLVIGLYSAVRTNAALVQHPAWSWLGIIAPKPIDLSGERLMQPAASYVARDSAIRAYWMEWCKMPDTDPCVIDAEGFAISLESAEFREDFALYRTERLQEVTVGGLAGSDFAGARFYQTVMPGLRLGEVNLEGADFEQAILEGVHLSEVAISGASFAYADLRAGRLTGSRVTDVSFRGANLEDARLFFDVMDDVDFRGADLRRTWITDAVVTADFSDGYEAPTLLEGLDARTTVFRHSLFVLWMNDRALMDANLLGVTRSGGGVEYQDTAEMPGTALQYVDLTALDHIFADMDDEANAGLIDPWDDLLQNSFGDGTNTLPDWVEAPCQWLDHEATGEEFYGVWRAWLAREPEDTRTAWPPLASLDQRLVDVTGEDGEVSRVPVSEVPARDDLLPKPEDCPWR